MLMKDWEGGVGCHRNQLWDKRLESSFPPPTAPWEEPELVHQQATATNLIYDVYLKTLL